MQGQITYPDPKVSVCALFMNCFMEIWPVSLKTPASETNNFYQDKNAVISGFTDNALLGSTMPQKKLVVSFL